MADSIDCALTDDLRKLQDRMWFLAYYVSLPLYFTIGLSGNIALLVAFHRQAKQEKAYAYQTYLTFSKVFEIFTFSLFMATYKWFSGVEAPGSEWYMKNYALMFFATHMASPIFNGFIMISLFLSVAMTADRVFALGKPFVYKDINHSRRQRIAVAACIFIGVSTNIFEVKHWRIRQVGFGENASYVGEFEQEHTEVAMVLGHLRTSVRLVGVAALVALNVAMVLVFRGRPKKVGQVLSSDKKKEQERKAADKSLLILTICQSCLMCFSQIPHSSHLIASFASASYGPCYGTISGPFVDTFIQIADAAEFFVVIAVNRRMRRAMSKILPCCASGGADTVTVVAPSASAGNPSSVNTRGNRM